jgi:hypothetical protein
MVVNSVTQSGLTFGGCLWLPSAWLSEDDEASGVVARDGPVAATGLVALGRHSFSRRLYRAPGCASSEPCTRHIVAYTVVLQHLVFSHIVLMLFIKCL